MQTTSTSSVRFVYVYCLLCTLIIKYNQACNYGLACDSLFLCFSFSFCVFLETRAYTQLRAYTHIKHERRLKKIEVVFVNFVAISQIQKA